MICMCVFMIALNPPPRSSVVVLNMQTPDEAGKKRKKVGRGGLAAKRAKGGSVSPTSSMFPLINGELRDYQLKGVTWLISLWSNGMNGILADQMGLGKTVQTITFLSHLRHNHIPGPFLIIVPLSTLANWHSEVQRWCPSMSSIVYHGDKKERQQMEKRWFKPQYSRMLPLCGSRACAPSATLHVCAMSRLCCYGRCCHHARFSCLAT